MISAASFLTRASAAGFRLYTGVPCSYLQPFINFVIDDPALAYIGAANEGDAVGIASGAAAANVRSVVMFQNSGFGNAVNPLTSLNAIFRLPVLVIATWRGEPGGAADEPQHELMGRLCKAQKVCENGGTWFATYLSDTSPRPKRIGQPHCAPTPDARPGAPLRRPR